MTWLSGASRGAGTRVEKCLQAALMTNASLAEHDGSRAELEQQAQALSVVGDGGNRHHFSYTTCDFLQRT